MTQAPIQSTLTLSCSLPPSELSLDGWVAFWADARLFRQFPALACTAAQGCCGPNGIADVDWMARQAGLSPRQFRRRCMEEAGLGPKRLARVLRFRYANRLAAAARRPDWSLIAASAGYFDQAHLIRDFREFTGRTPAAAAAGASSFQFHHLSISASGAAADA